MSWESAPGKYFQHYAKIEDLCRRHVGIPHKITMNRITGSKHDNHGNWRMTFDGKVQFRYKKDLTWFLLVAGQLQDPPLSWQSTRRI